MPTITDADKIIAKHQKKPPVQTVPIAQELGLEVYRVSGWANVLSGMIRRDKQHGGSSGFAIFVNASHHERRRRFTIAHEIAHFVLHNQLIGDGISDDGLYRSGLSSAVEAQANRYAADILMPWHLVNAEIERGNETVEGLAETFNVSQSAMSIRLGVPHESVA